MTELDIVNLQEICGIFLRFFQEVEHKYSGRLGHGLYLKHSGHYRLLGEMTLEERFVHRHVLDGHGMFLVNLYDLVDQQEGETVRNQFLDAVCIDYRGLVGIINGGLNFGMLHLMAHHAGEFVVDCVSGAYGHHAALDGTAYQGQVPYHVHHLVTGRLVVPGQRLGVDVT